MITFEAATADAVWRSALQHLRAVAPVQESRDQDTRELLHVAMTITDPRQRVVFARPINPAFAVAEVLWILAGANDVSFLAFWNPRMTRFTDTGNSYFHGAYGYRFGSQPSLSQRAIRQLRHDPDGASTRLDQLRTAYDVLRRTPHSRQVVLQIWNNTLDLPNPAPRSKDIPCNLISHLMIREGKLEWLQVMRSNDLIWGTPYNFIQFTTLQEIMAGWLGVEVGTYTHISDSLHVYERHWQQLETINVGSVSVPMNQADLRVGSYEEWERLWTRLVDGAIALTHHTDVTGLLGVAAEIGDVPDAYAQWVALLTAEALRRRGYIPEAYEAIERAGAHWESSWRRWAATISDAKQQRS